MSLREKMARAAALKDAKRAERQSIKTLESGADICAMLARGKTVNLENMLTAVRIFHDGGDELAFLKTKLGRKNRALLRMVDDELSGNWAADFIKLVEAVPLEKQRNPNALSFIEWREIGLSVGMPEEEVVNALRVMAVFRDR